MENRKFFVPQYDIGFTCGRFQVIHKGHEKMLKIGAGLCRRFIIVIGSA